MPRDTARAMSQENMNVDTLRAVLDAYNRCDFDAVGEAADPEIVLVPPGGQGPIKGADKLRKWMEPDAFESQVVEPLEFRAAGNKVLVRSRTKIRGAGSGIEMELLIWGVWTFNEAGRTIRVEIYLDHEEARALEAAGLRE